MADVSLRNVYKQFGKNEVIHGISCDIKEGGEIAIDRKVVNRLEPADRDIAMVFQNYALYPHMTVYKNMAYGIRIRRMPKEDIDRRVRNAAKILELIEFLDRKPRELSGWQGQRVAMGRCIVREPKVFLFDEPLSNLDAKLRVQMRLEIRKLLEDLRITSIFVTHN
jgi:sn-glycerol 3-phosphate transport system ATP-binding protein